MDRGGHGPNSSDLRRGVAWRRPALPGAGQGAEPSGRCRPPARQHPLPGLIEAAGLEFHHSRPTPPRSSSRPKARNCLSAEAIRRHSSAASTESCSPCSPTPRRRPAGAAGSRSRPGPHLQLPRRPPAASTCASRTRSSISSRASPRACSPPVRAGRALPRISSEPAQLRGGQPGIVAGVPPVHQHLAQGEPRSSRPLPARPFPPSPPCPRAVCVQPRRRTPAGRLGTQRPRDRFLAPDSPYGIRHGACSTSWTTAPRPCTWASAA